MMMFNPSLSGHWKNFYSDESTKPYFLKLRSFVETELIVSTVYPKEDDCFNAFKVTTFENLKVVILGQDPYHGEGQSHGLAFSVKEGTALPPSLRNIFHEYCYDLGYETPKNGNLSKWAEEGVFLLNTVLTVRAGQAHSHKEQGWEKFTDTVISLISTEKEHVVFILWGKSAQSKSKLIDTSKHLILNAPHPSPLSSYRGFFGSKPFSKTNEYLRQWGIKEIDWKLE